MVEVSSFFLKVLSFLPFNWTVYSSILSSFFSDGLICIIDFTFFNFCSIYVKEVRNLSKDDASFSQSSWSSKVASFQAFLALSDILCLISLFEQLQKSDQRGVEESKELRQAEDWRVLIECLNFCSVSLTGLVADEFILIIDKVSILKLKVSLQQYYKKSKLDFSK